MKIIVTGAGGQVGQELQAAAKNINDFSFYFFDKKSLDITDSDQTRQVLEKVSPDYIINAAAYTAVDKAEEEQEKAFAINADALKNLCQNISCKILHLSTDYIYHGSNKAPITEDQSLNPESIYAQSKLAGEEILRKHSQQALIIRTSWVYSSFGNNFVKTILRLGKERNQLSVINDQIGSPTYARDLAATILHIIHLDAAGNVSPHHWNDTYNYCNKGAISWYDFAKEIFVISDNNNTQITPISTSEYNALAPRPGWSVLDTTKISSTFNIKIIDWKVSLEKCIAILIN